jgi:hypothetical protein
MDRLTAIGSPLDPWVAPALGSRDASSGQNPRWISSTEPNPTGSLNAPRPTDPATDQGKTLHFISHIDAECFISLLQTMDPVPNDFRARTEYRRFYRQLREVLEVPPPTPNPVPVDIPTDPLK